MTALNRRDLLTLSLAAAGPLLVRCAPGAGPPPGTPERAEGGARRLRSDLRSLADGSVERRFFGPAVPEDLLVLDVDSGARRRLHALFPRERCPFAIDATRELGPGGYTLSVVDRTLAGMVPVAADAPWPLNMVPFGVAIDGVIIDPSGPWFDGGPADPNNPFDRACSGWEYDPIHPAVAALVGLPREVRGHVQPGPGGRPGSAGLFHYHGRPRVMLDHLRASLGDGERGQVLVAGYAADGLWILDGPIPPQVAGRTIHLFSGYVLRSGERRALPHTNPALIPPGPFDGTYVQDWRYDPQEKRAQIDRALAVQGEYLGLRAEEVAAGRADLLLLDERQGLSTEGLGLPEVPARSYAYALTADWPEVPRWFAREPSPSFRRHVIPLDAGMGPPGRAQLYAACGAELAEVHQWSGRPPY